MDRWDWTPFLAAPDDTPAAVHARWHAAGIVDGLPILPPSSDRIRRLYREAGLDPVRQLAVLEPSLRPVTVYDVAVCAAAAGCAAAHLAIVAAAVRAVAEPRFNLLGIQSTTGSAAPIVLVHGPLAGRAGVSGGGDCLGGSAIANATIGRALRLVLRSIGGATPGTMDAATMGQPAKLGLCFAENLGASPWPPLHSTLGFAAAADAVSVVGVSGNVEVVCAESEEAAEILVTVAGSMTAAGNVGSGGLIGGGSPLVVFAPESARALAASGLDRRAVQTRLWQAARLPLGALALAMAARIRRDRQESGRDPEAPLLIAAEPEDLLIAVAGGAGIKSTYFPGWGGGTRVVTVAL